MTASVIGNPSEALKALISGRMRFGRAEGRLSLQPDEKAESGRQIRIRLRLENPSYDTAVLSDFALVCYGEGGAVLRETPILEDRAPLTLRAWQHKTFAIDAVAADGARTIAVTWRDQQQNRWQTAKVTA